MYDESRPVHQQGRRRFHYLQAAGSLLRVPGVGTAIVFGSPYAMRIWLDPYKLHDYALQPSDIRAAIQAQNVQVSAGSIGGQPAVPGQALNATVTAQSQLQRPEQFRNIILKTTPDGAVVHLSDVARVELGHRQLRHCRPDERPSRRGYRHHAGTGRQCAQAGRRGEGPRLGDGTHFSARLQTGFPGRQYRFHPAFDPRCGRDPGRGHPAGHPGHVCLPAELAHHPGAGGGGAGGAVGHFRRAGDGGLFDQHPDLVRIGVGRSDFWSTTPSWWWRMSSASCARKACARAMPPCGR